MKKIASLISAICIMFSLVVTVSANSEFVVEDNKLISYTGNAEDVVIPAEVNGEAIIFIDSLAFDCNENIETVTIPEGVEIIKTEAFKNCYNLKEVIVPESLLDICAYAFSGCFELAPVEITGECTTIDEDAYEDADRNVMPSFFSVSDYTMDGGTIVKYNGLDTKLVIPDKIDGVTITGIGASAFQGNTTITSVTIPNTVKTIGEQAFYKCTGITELKLSENLTSCGKNAFAYCSGLTEITIPGSLSRTSLNMFYMCSGLKKAVVEEGVKTLNNYTFGYCSELIDLTLPESLEMLCPYSIGECKNLQYVKIPSKVTDIQSAAFYYCKKINNIIIPDSVTKLGTHAFRECWELSNIKLSKNIKTIGQRTFHGCAITTLDIPDGVTYIDKEVFYNCTKLESIELPAGVTTVGNQTFYNCPKLAEVTVYDSLETIGEDIFATATGKPNTTVNVYAPESSAMQQYAKENNIAVKPIVAENVAIIVGENSLGTYGTINYPVTDKVSVIGMSYIPEHLENDTEVPVLDISYDITDIENGNTFMTVMKSIPQEAMDWTYIAKPYVKLKDGTTIWGNSKTFGLDFITTLITWEE